MHKIVIHRPGAYDRLRYEEHPDPTPGPGEVLVAVASSSVNFADCAVRMGLYSSAKEYVGWPITPGFDLAGTVAAIGPDGAGEDALAVGDRVFGVSRFGAYATRVAVPRHPHQGVPPRGPPARRRGSGRSPPGLHRGYARGCVRGCGVGAPGLRRGSTGATCTTVGLIHGPRMGF